MPIPFALNNVQIAKNLKILSGVTTITASTVGKDLMIRPDSAIRQFSAHLFIL